MTMKTFENDDRRPWQGLMSGLALMLCLSVPAGAFGEGTNNPRGEGGNSGSFAGGDETVGTLPATNSDDGGGVLDPGVDWGGFTTLGSTLTLEGSTLALMTTVRSLHGQTTLVVEQLDGGRQRWTLSGDFDLALDLGLLPGADLTIAVGTRADAWSAISLRNRDLGQVALTAHAGLDLPLGQLVQNGQVPSGLTVTTVDGFGTATRLAVQRTRQGLVLSQRSVVALD
jgi:hypothetical protein